MLIDRLLGGVIEGAASATPPGAPSVDGLYAVAAGASGAWAGQGGLIAASTPSGWRFIAPIEGMQLVERTSGRPWRRTASGWEVGRLHASELFVDGLKVVGARGAAIAAPSGGATVDSEARGAIGAMLTALRAHGLIGT